MSKGKIHYYHNSEYWDEMAKKYPAQVNERELFLTKQTETISATQVSVLYWLVLGENA